MIKKGVLIPDKNQYSFTLKFFQCSCENLMSFMCITNCFNTHLGSTSLSNFYKYEKFSKTY